MTTTLSRLGAFTLFVILAACDKPAPSGAAASASAPPSAAPVVSATASATPSAAATAAESASAAPAASASAGGSTKDVTLSILDPATDSAKTVKVPVGGSVTVYLPQWVGSSWTIPNADKSLGKAKEQTIPGFAGPTTPAHQFQWTISGPLLKAGQSHKVQIVNKQTAGGAGAAAPTTFTLTIDIV